MLERMIDGQRVAVPAAEETTLRADWRAARIATGRRRLKAALEAAALQRVRDQVPEWATIDALAVVAGLWPAVAATATPAQGAARAIFVYLRDTALPAVDGLATLAALAGVDPSAAAPFGASVAGWPAGNQP